MKTKEKAEIKILTEKGHSYHCACRIVWGDGCCSCDMEKKGYDPYWWMKNEIPLCKCGCGNTVTFNNREKTWNKFYKNHNGAYRGIKHKELDVKPGYKWCSKCQSIKKLDKSPPRRAAHDGHDYRCKDCHKESSEKWKKENPDKYRLSKKKTYLKYREKEIKRSKDNRIKQRSKWMDIVRLKGMDKCSRCGFDKHFCAIDFHHTDPYEKDFKIAQIIDTKPTTAKIAELDKCIPLCANCHRILHHGDEEL